MSITSTASIIRVTNEASTNLTAIQAAVGSGVMTKSGNNFYTNRSLVFEGTTNFLDDSKNLYMDGTDNYIELDTTATFQMGLLDGNGDTYAGCNVVRRNVFNSQWSNASGLTLNRGSGQAGDVKLYACHWDDQWNAVGSTFVFWRIHRGTSQIVDFRDCVFEQLGGRLGGTASKIRNCQVTNAQPGTTGTPVTFNPVDGFTDIDGLIVRKSAYAIYYRASLGGDSVARGLRASNITGATVNSDASFTTLKSCRLIDPNLASGLTVYWVQNLGTPGVSPQVIEEYSYTLTALDSAGATLAAVERRVTNSSGTQVALDTSNGSGVFTTLELVRRILTASANTTGAATTTVTRTPHVVRLRKYGYTFQNVTHSATSTAVTSVLLATNAYVTLSAASAAALTGISINHGTQTVTITASRTLSELYDYCQNHLATSGNLQYGEFLTTSDGSSYSSAYSIVVSGSGVVLSSSAGKTLTSTGTITTASGGSVDLTRYTDSTGAKVKLAITGLVSGARFQVYNLTDSSQLLNTTASGTSYSGYLAYTADKQLRLRVAYVSGASAKELYESEAFLTASGATFAVTMADDTIYNANAIDGSAVTEFSADYPNVQVDVSDPDQTTTVQRLYAWYQNNLMTSSGIADFFGGMAAEDLRNYRINTGVVDIKLDNTAAGFPVTVTGARIYRDDDTPVTANGSEVIEYDAGKAYIAEGDVWGAAIEGAYTAEQLLRGISAVLMGKSSGGPGSPVFRDVNDTVNRVSGAADGDGDRSAVTLDLG